MNPFLATINLKDKDNNNQCKPLIKECTQSQSETKPFDSSPQPMMFAVAIDQDAKWT